MMKWRRRGLPYVSPYNDRLIIAGNGTIGLEILENLPGITTVIVPVGGRGLILGINLTVKSIKPKLRFGGTCSKIRGRIYIG